MTALYIVAGILAFIILLLFLRIRITVSYKKPRSSAGAGATYVGIGPVRIKLYPGKKKEPRLSDFSAKKYRELMSADAASKSEATPKEQKSEKKKNELLPGGIGETFELIIELAEKFTGHLRCEVLSLRLTVGTKNAASTALLYSGAVSAISFLLEVLDEYTELRLRSPKDITVDADFEDGEICGDIAVRFSIRIINILRAGSGFIINYFRTMVRLDKQNESNKKNTSRSAAERR